MSIDLGLGLYVLGLAITGAGFALLAKNKSHSGTGLLSHNELLELLDQGVIKVDKSKVKGSSIDVTLDQIIRIEDEPKFNAIVDLRGKENIETREFSMTDEYGYQIVQGEFILASIAEYLEVPDDISVEFRLKSSVARNGLEQLNACWIDPGFRGKVTLELLNVTRKHRLTIKPGMPIGQLIFRRHKKVPDHASYRVTGQYNGQTKATASKGIR